jgi:hypothetical protein
LKFIYGIYVVRPTSAAFATIVHLIEIMMWRYETTRNRKRFHKQIAKPSEEHVNQQNISCTLWILTAFSIGSLTAVIGNKTSSCHSLI